MKRFAMAALAVATFAGTLAPGVASARDHNDRRGDRHYDRGRDHDRRDRYDRDYDNRDDRRDERRAHRQGYREGRWDGRRYNGYYRGNNWYYGPPPAQYSDYRPGYRAWRRGDRLPSYYRNQYVVVRDYNRYGYRAPPRGYHYVRDDRGDVLLVGIATGVILGILASQ